MRFTLQMMPEAQTTKSVAAWPNASFSVRATGGTAAGPRVTGGCRLGCWAAFSQHHLTAQITYSQNGWRVQVMKAGRTQYARHHRVYVTALAALQEELHKAGAEPGSTSLLQ
jgi:hypothetical protein